MASDNSQEIPAWHSADNSFIPPQISGQSYTSTKNTGAYENQVEKVPNYSSHVVSRYIKFLNTLTDAYPFLLNQNSQPTGTLKSSTSTRFPENSASNSQPRPPPQTNQRTQSFNIEPQGQQDSKSHETTGHTSEHLEQYEQIIRRNRVGRDVNSAEYLEVQRIQKEVDQDDIRFNIIPMDSTTKEQVRSLLVYLTQPAQNLSKAAVLWYRNCGDQQRLRRFFRIRKHLAMQYHDDKIEVGNLKDDFCISLHDAEIVRRILNEMVQDLREKFPHLRKESSSNRVVPA